MQQTRVSEGNLLVKIARDYIGGLRKTSAPHAAVSMYGRVRRMLLRNT